MQMAAAAYKADLAASSAACEGLATSYVATPDVQAKQAAGGDVMDNESPSEKLLESDSRPAFEGESLQKGERTTLSSLSFLPSVSMSKWFAAKMPESEDGADSGKSSKHDRELPQSASNSGSAHSKAGTGSNEETSSEAGDSKRASTFQTFMDRLHQAKDLKKLVLARIASITNSAAARDAALSRLSTSASAAEPAWTQTLAQDAASVLGHGGGRGEAAGLEQGRSSVQEQAMDLIPELQQRVRSHPLWSHACTQELEIADEAIEKLVTLKLYHILFGAQRHELMRDLHLRNRILCLQFLQPKHLDIDGDVLQRPSLQSCLDIARRELCKMNNYKSPKDKLVCIFNCCSLASRVLTLSSEHSTGADELLPLLILLLLQANPAALYSNISFIANCRQPSRLNGEQGYYLTNIMSAAEFVSEVSHPPPPPSPPTP
jgi:hypothetical protein